MKPIEPNCRCMVIKSIYPEFMWAFVKAIRIDTKQAPPETSWVIEIDDFPPPDGHYYSAHESALLRIDGDPDEEKEVTKELELTQ